MCVSSSSLLLFFLQIILQNPVHSWGDIILVLGDKEESKKGRDRQKEEGRNVVVVVLCCVVPPPQRRRRPSVETLHAVARLSSIPHLDLEETLDRVSHVTSLKLARFRLCT